MYVAPTLSNTDREWVISVSCMMRMDKTYPYGRNVILF